MKLPKNNHEEVHKRQKSSRWIVVLSVMAIVVSLASASLSALTYFNTPSEIHNYVQSHKSELKGDKGDRGEIGPTGLPGIDGTNSYAPTRCSTFDYSFGSSTNCY